MLSLQLTPLQISKIGCPQIINIADQLPVNPNYNWEQLTGGPRDINDLTTIVLHHDAYPKKNTVKQNDLQMATTIANLHINKKTDEPKGEGGIAYHVFVRNGQAYQVNNILDFTYGAASNNGYTVHIVVSGDYVNGDVLTNPDRIALHGAIFAVINALPHYKGIKAHRELTPTACPGYDYNGIRDDITKLQVSFMQASTWKDRVAKCNRINSQINYMDSLIAKGEEGGTAKWALQQKELIYKIMDGQKLL